ncbi:hypothetical protein GCM10010168_93380 [Actinoplanes ianthinogenes]|uniref:Uncharacterized protein n=1 Tax=Actinoplanes ianthinogenes TaxID=122358 RepID=A0ABM7LKL3_9ACTN|nr:hypothetical protein [Actinoplanes ianthinogenes]BCJ39789.1 hypothetical protein Aiant_04460 [Actinoplanes ianthinogenes]GGR59915.1 hypothetical protein GCM10010168_93380 [Actinoplanes ianthinogenes]
MPSYIASTIRRSALRAGLFGSVVLGAVLIGSLLAHFTVTGTAAVVSVVGVAAFLGGALLGRRLGDEETTDPQRRASARRADHQL